MSFADIYTQTLSTAVDAWITAHGRLAYLRRRKVDEDLYGDKVDKFTEVRPIRFMLRLPESSLVGTIYNVDAEEALPATGQFRNADSVKVTDIVEMNYPVKFGEKLVKYLEVVRLVHRHGGIAMYELGVFKGSLEF